MNRAGCAAARATPCPLLFAEIEIAIAISISPLAAQPAIESVSIDLAHGPQQPSSVPILPGLNVGRLVHYGPLVGEPAPGAGYEPVDGDSFARHNGPGTFQRILTTGAWWLRAGDRPRLRMELRTAAGAYASPGILPDLGVAGDLRVSVTSAGRTRWLDEFESIDAVLSPGSVRWTCRDTSLGVTLDLRADMFVDRFGFACTADLLSSTSEVELAWTFDRANHVEDDPRHVEYSTGKYTRIYLGLAGEGGRSERGRLLETLGGATARTRSRCICVWGYSDYNRQGVADALKRLELRPFADPAWVEEMKRKWFDHWIGRGLEPERRFRETLAAGDEAVANSIEFWDRQRGRLRISTPDPRFDTAVNSTAARARVQFEYPAFIHGLGYAKYGKINHGYYGFEAAGLHDEVADSLRFVSGTQDAKGRQRYSMTTFAISDWHEDMDFYFAEQVWWHWRWTGDRSFLRALWPSARRAIEHGLAASDPDGDGIMTGYYEMWNCDQSNPGGLSALQTAMAWSALRAGADMAAALDDIDYTPRAGSSAPPSFAERYRRLAGETRRQYETRLWNRDVGAWSSAEWNGVLRPRPHTCEQNYAVWRGIGGPLESYMALRYIRENLHRRDLERPGTFEFVNDWWPIQWSHHYIASGDACATFHSACRAGDVDGHWPVFRTIAESAYANGGEIWQGTGSNAMELEPLFLQAVVDGLCGVKPWFGENLLVLRPSPPSDWDRFSLRHVDVEFSFERMRDAVVLRVKTPVERRIRAEIPIRAAPEEATLDGAPIDVRFEAAVGCARAVIEAPAAREHIFRVALRGDELVVSGRLLANLGRRETFAVRGATYAGPFIPRTDRRILDPQGAIRETSIAAAADGPRSVSFVPARLGKPTVFLELRAGKAVWFHPLDLDVREPWSIVRRYRPGLDPAGPAVISPAVDEKKRTLVFEVENHSGSRLSGSARIFIAGRSFDRPLAIDAGASVRLDQDLADVWDRLPPGSIPFRLEWAGRAAESDAVNWKIGAEGGSLASRLLRIDLRPHYNAEMASLFSAQTQWRIDYTGVQHGVDWRRPPPPRDARGFILMNSCVSIYEYGTLPEQWVSAKRAVLAPPRGEADLGIGVPFVLAPAPGAGELRNDILAICATEPLDRFPSAARIRLGRAARLEKLYLLTANLAKTLKCYYPGGEIIARYAGGGEEHHLLAPPYTMPSLVSHICPRAHAVRCGALQGDGNPVNDSACYLSVTDVALDPARILESVELRCVATETLLGIAGMTMLEAPGPTPAVDLRLRTRDPRTNEVAMTPRAVDPRRVGIVIVDPWNYHWCMTWTEQAGGMTPRMNRALRGARSLGATILWAPTDTAGMFAGWPQRQRAMAVPYVDVPKAREIDCKFTVPWGACLCGPGISCRVDYGHDGMHPDLEIAPEDLIVSGTQELYSICRARGLDLLIYMGGATNICLTGKDVGLGPMYRSGIDCAFARDLAFAWTAYDPAKGYTPTRGNDQAAEDLERGGIPTLSLAEELGRIGLWDDSWITEPVRITPAGRSDRPYLFEREVRVSLEAPFVEGAEIRYTLDGTEPGPASPKYADPLAVTDTTRIRAAAFRGGRRVSLESKSLLVRLPAMPPAPDRPLETLAPVPDLYAKIGATYAACLWQPKTGTSYEGKPLRIRATPYERGLGMRAPAYARYAIAPEFERFVALAGVDDRMLDLELGRSIAMHPSVVFKVFIDGALAAESPVLRISQAPWRFDVRIPAGSRQISLVCDDAGSRSPYDLGDWVEAGFVVRR